MTSSPLRTVRAALFVSLTLGGLNLVGHSHALDPSRAASQHTFRQWRIHDALPQNTVQAIAQGPNGLLWLSTHSGLRWFDGVTFGRLHHQPDILKNHHVYALTTDSDGGLWIGTAGGGLLNYSEGEFRHFSHDNDFPTRVVRSLASHGSRIWVGSESSGLMMIENDIVHHWGEAEGIPQNTINQLSIDPAGNCWVAVMNGGVYRVTPEGEVLSLGTEEGLLSLRARAIEVEPDGTLWVGFQEGLGRYRDGTWRYWTVDDGLPDTPISNLLVDRDGNLWIGTVGAGPIRIRKGGVTPEILFDSQNPDLKIIWTIFEDLEGNLWVGSLGNGLGRLSDGPVIPIGLREGLSHEIVNAVAQSKDGTVWATTHGGGIQRVREGVLLPPLTVEDGLSSNSAWSLGFDSSGDLWSTSLAPGVDHVSNDGITTYTSRDGLGEGRLLGVLGDPRGNVWISGDHGLTRIHPPEGSGKRRMSHFTTAHGLVHDRTSPLALEPPKNQSDRIWIGTSRGVSVWSEETGFTNYTAADGLRNERVWSILPQGEGNAWIGTFGGGLHRLRDGIVDLVLNEEHGLPSNDVTALVEDDLGYLWLAGTRGLARLPLAEMSKPSFSSDSPLGMFRFDTAHGMRSAEVFGASPRGLKTFDGHLFFTSLSGLAVVDPSNIRIAPPPRITIREILLDGERLSPSISTLILPPTHRNLTISFSTDTLVTPDRIKVKRRLLGLGGTSEAWQVVEARRIELSRLPPGSYALEIEPSDSQGRFRDLPYHLSILVKPHFWDTWPFALFLSLLLVAVGIGIQQWRVRLLKAKQVELQEAVDHAVAKIQILRGLLPMCASCKRIRDDDGYWQGVETYITDHSELAFSHGICPSCADDFLSQLEIDPGEEYPRPS